MVNSIFDYVIIYTEKDKDSKEKKSVIIAQDRTIAKDINSAIITAARKIPKTYESKTDGIEIFVRPF